MSTSRARRSVLKLLTEQFRMYGLTVHISYDEYVKIVDAPVARRTIAAGWGGRWVRVMNQLASFSPDLAKQPVSVQPASTADEKLAKLRALSTAKVEEENHEQDI